MTQNKREGTSEWQKEGERAGVGVSRRLTPGCGANSAPLWLLLVQLVVGVTLMTEDGVGFDGGNPIRLAPPQGTAAQRRRHHAEPSVLFLYSEYAEQVPCLWLLQLGQNIESLKVKENSGQSHVSSSLTKMHIQPVRIWRVIDRQIEICFLDPREKCKKSKSTHKIRRKYPHMYLKLGGGIQSIWNNWTLIKLNLDITRPYDQVPQWRKMRCGSRAGKWYSAI